MERVSTKLQQIDSSRRQLVVWSQELHWLPTPVLAQPTRTLAITEVDYNSIYTVKSVAKFRGYLILKRDIPGMPEADVDSLLQLLTFSVVT